MKPLIIQEETSTPKVVLDSDNNKFEISGNSLPEDVMSFYMPIFNWLDEYKKQPNARTEFVFRLSYFNSASAKIILDVLNSLEEIATTGKPVEIRWHYMEIDEDMLATGKEFESMLKMPFTYITYMPD
jgi:hypothetical protein